MQNKYILNNTPIRTCVKYKINDIIIENLYLPSKTNEFKSFEVNCENVEISNVSTFDKLTYGAGEILEENIAKFCNSSYYIKPTKSDAKFEVTYTFNNDNTELSNYIIIDADKDMSARVVFRSDTNTDCYHNFILKINVKNKANVHVEVVNLLNDKTNHFISVENEIEEDSKLNLIMVDMGGKYSVSNVYSNMIGDRSNLQNDSIYIGQNEDIKDLNYVAHLRGKKSVADIDVQGVLDDRSKKNLKFTIDFKTGCTKASGKENESCMLLSDDARYIALPILLCSEDDVEGAHSAAAGKVDSSQLFYIMSRGFEKKEAIKMLVKAKYNEILEKIQDEELKKELFAEVDRRL